MTPTQGTTTASGRNTISDADLDRFRAARTRRIAQEAAQKYEARD